MKNYQKKDFKEMTLEAMILLIQSNFIAEIQFKI
jgi:hypothetical protein